MESCSFVHMLMITFLFVIELTPHMETMPFAMLCQISGTNYLNHFVLLTVLKLLNLIWKHIYFQNDIVSVPSKVVIKLFIYLSCSVLYFKIFVKRFVHIYAEALYKYCLLLFIIITFCRKPHWNWSIGFEDMSNWRMPKTIGNKRHFLLCLTLS